MDNPAQRSAKALKQVKNLSTLKQKQVHKVLDELNIIRVIKLYASNDNWICQCIRTHAYYRTLFSNGQDALKLIRTLNLWHSIAEQNKLLYADYTFNLRKPYSNFIVHQLPTWKSLIQPLQAYIAPKVFVLPVYLAICDSLNLDTDVLVPEVKVDPWDLDIQERRWRCMKVCQEALNAQKSKQLYRLANLIEKYPHMLKKHLDPGVEARPNSKHIINYFRSCAEGVKKEWCFRSGYRMTPSLWWSEDVVHLPQLCCSALFRGEGLPLIPVQKYRELFKAQLRLNPPQAHDANTDDFGTPAYWTKELNERWDKRGLSEKVQNIAITQSPHIYPDSVHQDYITSIKGIVFGQDCRPPECFDDVYTRDEEDSAKRYQRHRFRHGHDPDSFKTPEELGYERPRTYLPFKYYAHDDSQLDWLEAFLKTCSYMEANLPQTAEGETAGSTVANTEDMKKDVKEDFGYGSEEARAMGWRMWE